MNYASNYMSESILNMNELKDILQDGNVNFLFGSGMSYPYFPTLGRVEFLLTELEKSTTTNDNVKKIVKSSLYKYYFDGVINKNLNLLQSTASNKVLESYNEFLKIFNSILLKRKSTILSKQVNIFTTNIDIFFEKSFEETGIESNDGFSGRFNPVYNISNFKKSQFKKSLHYDNTSEIPVFNLMKIHGSLTWQLDEEERILFSPFLAQVEVVRDKNIPSGSFIDIEESDSLENLLIKASELTVDEEKIDKFLLEYEKLSIVNPNKDKFRDTILNQTYYDLLRIFSNELEKENTIIFALGFSFADEHILNIALRAANSNPTLMIYVIGHTSNAIREIEGRFDPCLIKNNNIKFISPPAKNEEDGTVSDEFEYDFENINNRFFRVLLEKTETRDDKKIYE